ncbi:hypothetical protein ADK76_10835 [Streptomyces griseoflavus]|uniref:hypothetical protein n=1 Tax=Streptomyces rimosus TaxID=1927 RepID=UPI0004C6BB1D|nr:hypothetical protein [Streptomyces rimosus]KOG63996.1 hypothetical protein ADK76_10835 [Streptomyces griseoflavus]
MTTATAGHPAVTGPATVVPHWATPVWLGTLQPAADTALLRHHMHRSRHGSHHLDADLILDTEHATATLRALAALLDPSHGTAAVHLEAHIWAAGHRIPLAYGSGPWTAWCYLAIEGSTTDHGSGALCLHDPRAGCDAATVPGLPWGRPLTVRAAPGLTVVAPGWLASSVLPVSPGHALAVLTAHTTAPAC